MSVKSFCFRAGIIPTVVTGVLLVVLLYLGSWQLAREQEKLQQQASHSLGQSSVVLEIREPLRDSEGFEHRRVQATGKYDVGHQFLLDNRTHGGVAGYYVLSPLIINSHTSILVNRGWVPVGNDRTVLPALDTSKNTLLVAGRLARAPRTVLLGDDGYTNEQWPKVVQSVDYEKMTQLLGYQVMPAVIRLDPASDWGFVREWKAFSGISPERHRGYAIQWFLLAATLTILYLAFGLKRRKES